MTSDLQPGGGVVASAGPVSKNILSIQVMRGVAAILVVLYHTSIILAQPEYGHIVAFPNATSKGWTGVNFFFVLSGFIIFHAHSADIGKISQLGRYVWRRFSRVYPVYWLFLTAFIAASLLGLGYPDSPYTLTHLGTAFTLIQLSPDLGLPLKVAWTLIYEVGFYFLFSFLIINRKLGTAVFAIWGGVIWYNAFVVQGYKFGLGSIWSANFFFGAAAMMIMPKVNGRMGIPILAIGAAILAACFVLVPSGQELVQESPETMLLLALAFTLLLLGGSVAEVAHGFRPPAFLILLGNASYSIYLVHSAAISLLCTLNHKLVFGVIPPEILFVLVAVSAVAAGVIAHLLIERPLLGALRAAVRSPRPAPTTPSVPQP